MNRPGNDGIAVESRNSGRWLRILASYLVAGACLFWVFHDIRLDPFFAGIARIRWEWMAVGVVFQFLAYFCVAWEWKLLLHPAGRIPFWRAAQAVFAGRFANDALPLQLGYLVRALLAARWMKVNVILIFPSLIVERLWDGIWLAVGIGAVALSVPLPSPVLRAADIFGAIILAGTAIIVFFTLRANRMTAGLPLQTADGIRRRLRSALHHLFGGMRDIGRSNLLVPVVGLSLLKLAIQAAAFLEFLWAYNLDLSIGAGLAVFLVGYFGICIPSTPAGTGMFQLFVVAGLTVFGIAKSDAAGFALVAFVTMTVPLAIAGFFALAQTGMHLRQIQGETSRLNPSA